jgi:branched-subunit amino acid transport protein AzlD
MEIIYCLWGFTAMTVFYNILEIVCKALYIHILHCNKNMVLSIKIHGTVDVNVSSVIFGMVCPIKTHNIYKTLSP